MLSRINGFILMFMIASLTRIASQKPFQVSKSRAAKLATKCPPEPINFGKAFSLPDYEDKLQLEYIHGHPKDVDLTFKADDHTYFFKNTQVSVSVTSLVSSFFEKFNADKSIEKMIQGKNWPRPEYQHENGTEFSAEEIKTHWDINGEIARNQGTWMHYNIERFLNNLHVSEDMREMELFVEFYQNEIRNVMEPWRTEWRICDAEKGVAGSVDFVGKLKDGSFCIMDWKRSKRLAGSGSSSYGRRAKHPISHLDDCDMTKYFLQLNVYRYILETNYGLTVSSMKLASFHPNDERYFCIEVPVWEEEVRSILPAS